MPKFIVRRGRDAWSIEEAIVDHPEVTTPAEVEEWASWWDNAKTLEWLEAVDLRIYDHTQIMEGETEEIDDAQERDFKELLANPTKDYGLTPREHATVLAALRYWQRWTIKLGPSQAPEADIATDGGTITPLTAEEIDALCERINV